MFGRRTTLWKRLLTAASLLLAAGVCASAYLALSGRPTPSPLGEGFTGTGGPGSSTQDGSAAERDLAHLWMGRDPERAVTSPPTQGRPEDEGKRDRVPFKLRGVIYSSGDDSVAFVAVGEELLLLGQGEELQGWKVAAIQPRAVVLERGDTRLELAIQSLPVAERPVADLTANAGQGGENEEGVGHFRAQAGAAAPDAEGAAETAQLQDTARTRERPPAYRPPALEGADARVRVPETLVDKVRQDPGSVEFGVRYSWQLDGGGKMAGYRIDRVEPGSLAARYGLAPGDRILAVNGVPLDSPARALELYRRFRGSDSARVTIARNGETKDVLYYVR